MNETEIFLLLSIIGSLTSLLLHCASKIKSSSCTKGKIDIEFQDNENNNSSHKESISININGYDFNNRPIPEENVSDDENLSQMTIERIESRDEMKKRSSKN